MKGKDLLISGAFPSCLWSIAHGMCISGAAVWFKETTITSGDHVRPAETR